MIKIVTDTIACLPPELVKKYDIKIIPISLVIDEKIYRDDQLSNDEFWKLFYAAKTTSTQAASPGEFAALFESLSGTTDTIFCIPVSKGLSTTYEAAMQAREIVQKTNNKLRVEVIDSRSCTGAQGFLVLEAARAAEAGKSAEEIRQLVEEMIPRVKMLTILETLKYIIRIGRAPKTAVIGELFQVKPIVGMVNNTGVVENIGRANGKKKALEKIVEEASKYIDPKKPLHVMFHYADKPEAVEQLKSIITAKFNCVEVYVTPYSAVMSSGSGPVTSMGFYSG